MSSSNHGEASKGFCEHKVILPLYYIVTSILFLLASLQTTYLVEYKDPTLFVGTSHWLNLVEFFTLSSLFLVSLVIYILSI